MSKYSPIYKFVKKRQKLSKKILQVQNKAQKFRDQIRELERPFWGGALNTDLYQDFFSNYCIRLTEPDKSYCQYKVTDIVLDTESGTNSRLFWKAIYEFKEYDKDKKLTDQFIGSLSLRKLMKLMLQPGASFQKI